MIYIAKLFLKWPCQHHWYWRGVLVSSFLYRFCILSQFVFTEKIHRAYDHWFILDLPRIQKARRLRAELCMRCPQMSLLIPSVLCQTAECWRVVACPLATELVEDYLADTMLLFSNRVICFYGSQSSLKIGNTIPR